jgi:proline iminopeptidase
LDATIDGTRIFWTSVGPEDRYPLIVLHGGPGFDHTEMHPWLDPLSDTFRLIYVDQRGQGRSERVDPSTLTLLRLAQDVSGLAAALDLERYVLLGHSFGAFVALAHAVELGEASHYVISGGSASFAKSSSEIEENLARFEPAALREQVSQSLALEPAAKTQADVERIWEMQAPFHFATSQCEAYERYMDASANAIYAPEVLAYFATQAYPVEYEDRLGQIRRHALVITGAHDRSCTPRAARDMHAGIAGSELVVLPDAGHMTFVEQPGMYFAAVRDFFRRHPVAASE